MVAMNDLDLLAANQPGNAQDQAQLQRALGWRGVKRYPKLADDRREFPSARAGQVDILSRVAQGMCQLDALIIRASTRQQRIKVDDAHGFRSWRVSRHEISLC